MFVSEDTRKRKERAESSFSLIKEQHEVVRSSYARGNISVQGVTAQLSLLNKKLSAALRKRESMISKSLHVQHFPQIIR